MWERIIHSLRDLSSRRRELDVLLFKGTPETRRYTLRNGLNQKADDTACNSSLLISLSLPLLPLGLERSQACMWKKLQLATFPAKGEGGYVQVEQGSHARTCRNDNLARILQYAHHDSDCKRQGTGRIR